MFAGSAVDDDPDVADDVLEVEVKLMDIFCRDAGVRLKSKEEGSDHAFPVEIRTRLPVLGKHAYPCEETYSFIPTSPPTKWPQRPLLLRPTPESGMRIRGVRYSSSKTYTALAGTGYCLGCTLPVNNGTERPGKCLVVDFETDLFIGTAMLRIKDIPLSKSADKSVPEGRDANSGDPATVNDSYFHNKKRTFQAIVRGRFKVPDVPMSECVTGQVFHRAAGPGMPSRWVTKGAISIISRLAPQLQARLNCDRPRFLSPFVSTAQSVVAHRRKDIAPDKGMHQGADETLEQGIYEPNPSDQSSLLQDLEKSGGARAAGISGFLMDSPSIKKRTKNRKKAYDKLHAKKIKVPTFDTEAEYTFEFFQHLIVFKEFALDFGKPVGQHPLGGILNGQPLKFMAAHQVVDGAGEEMRWLWCFDLWHESLYADAIKAGN